jgi:hypothetical protein
MSEYKVQSVILDNKKYNLTKAVEFLIRNKYKYSKVDKTLNFWRFRQLEPSSLRREGFNHYITKDISDGVKLVLGYKLPPKV